jgi:hypothetical protein
LRAFANGRKVDWDGHLHHQQRNIDPWRRPGALFYRPQRAPPAPAVASSRRPAAGESPAHYAADAGDGGDGTGAAGGGAGGTEGEARRWPGHSVQGGWGNQVLLHTKEQITSIARHSGRGDRVLLRTKELLESADIRKLCPRWDGPFTVTACPSPNAYTLALPRLMRCSPTVNVDCLKPFFERLGTAPAPGPVFDAGQEGEHEVELLFNRRLVRCVTHYLVLWRGHTSADDECLRAEDLTHCQEKVAEYNATAPRRRPARLADPAAPAPLVPPAGFRLAASSEGLPGTALIGQAVLRGSTTGRWMAGSAVQWPLAAELPAFRTWCVTAALLPSGRRWYPRCSTRLRTPGRSMGAPPSRCSLAQLPFSWTTVMGLQVPADGSDAGHAVTGCRRPMTTVSMGLLADGYRSRDKRSLAINLEPSPSLAPASPVSQPDRDISHPSHAAAPGPPGLNLKTSSADRGVLRTT